MSFKLPEQAAELLDEYRVEVRAEALTEVLALLADCELAEGDELRVALRLKELLS